MLIMVKIWKYGIFVSLCLSSSQTLAFDFIQNTYFVDLHHGGYNSKKAIGIGNVAFESSSGYIINLSKKYAPKWLDTEFGYITMLDKNHSIIWGFSTGQKAEKIVIAPSFRLGFVSNYEFNKHCSTSLKFTYIFGGDLKEKTCTATYGELGTYEVNCRLAHTYLPPSETLKYLINDNPYNRTFIQLSYNYTF